MSVGLWRNAGAGLFVAMALACGDDGGGRGASATAPTGLTGIATTGGGSSTTIGEATADDGGVEDETGTINCTEDADCPLGQRDAPMSRRCLDPTACLFNEDCDSGFTCEDGVCTIGGCGGFQFEITAVPPNLMLLLDRSGSMDNEVPNTGQNRWEVARDAITQVTTAFDDTIRFGLATYSSCLPGGCSPGSIVTPITDNNAANIIGFLNNTVGEGSNNGMQTNAAGQLRYLCDSGDPETTTGPSLFAMVGEVSLQDPERTNAILLITDGFESPDCTSNGAMSGSAGAMALLGQTIPVQTFAVGFGGADLNEVNAVAAAGGTEMGYLAEQPQELQMAFDEIAQAVASCTFELDQVPPDTDMIYVFFDKDPAGVPIDATNGWTYDPLTNTITFHGQACDAIKSGTVVDVDIVYGCNVPPVG